MAETLSPTFVGMTFAQVNVKQWYFVTKIVLTYCDREKNLKSEADHYEQFVQTVKGQNAF